MLASDRKSRPSAPTLLQALAAFDKHELCEYLDVVIIEEQEMDSQKTTAPRAD
jgi:hypothetical protein